MPGSWEYTQIFRAHISVHSPMVTNGTMVIPVGDEASWAPWLACLPSARPQRESCLDCALSDLPSVSPHTLSQQAGPGPGLQIPS